MKYVPQEDPMGCGVACVANRLDISYSNAMELFEYPEFARTIGYRCKYVVEALQKADEDVKLKHIRRDQPLPNLPSGSIVLLEKSDKYPQQHYLLKVDQGWVDPWINIHTDSRIEHAKPGIRSKLPGRAYYAIVDNILSHRDINLRIRRSRTPYSYPHKD